MEPKSSLTYDAEGRDEVCCRMHWPGGASGVTIGHGYDLGHREPGQVAEHLAEAGIDALASALLTRSCGLTHDTARDFVINNSHEIELTRDQMVRLFNISFDEQAAEVTRICRKADCVEVYGAVDLEQLDQRIWLILVDLKFRGDYHPRSRKRIQRLVSTNDFPAFKIAMANEAYWPGVPPDRFIRRVDFLSP